MSSNLTFAAFEDFQHTQLGGLATARHLVSKEASMVLSQG